MLWWSAVLSAQTLSQRPEAARAPVGAPAQANSDPTYQQLRNVGLSGEVSAVNNLVLKRDAGTFTFRSGSFYFLTPVNGKVTGAVFVGDGSFTVKPPTAMERKNLGILTGGSEYREDFDRVVLRFTDGTEAEIRQAGAAGPAGTGDAIPALNESFDQLRTKLRYNLTARLLQDVLSPRPGGFFAAFVKGRRYSGRTLYVIDPQGVGPISFSVAPEEVALMTYEETKFGVWAAFHLAAEYANGTATSTQKNAFLDIDDQELETTIEKNARLDGKARMTFSSGVDGLRVAMFDLFPSLRVSSVTGPNGEPLSFIQEDKKEDADFAVILPRPLAKNERYSITTAYGGRDAVSNEGSGNYYPIARDDWYPNTTFGDYASYHMTFRSPKGMKLIASGTPLREINEGGQMISEWKSEVPQAVAGFNFGSMKREEAKLEAEHYLVESYANDDLPDYMKGVQQAVSDEITGGMTRTHIEETAMGTMSTIPMMKRALGEGQLSIGLYTAYFGPAPYKRLSITQQTACNYGQAWPGLVYLPLCSFFDDTQRHELFRGAFNQSGLISYFKVVNPHEVAHQWWGHTVGFNSYRDQWMSEGFAHFSASLFLQKYRTAEYLKFWDDQRRELMETNRQGARAIDVGPVVMGIRVNNSKTGVEVYRDLVYPKGAYILHMLRMMLWDPRTGDQRFKEMMQDFVRTYANRTASTEDFKAMVEKHLPAELNFTGDGKLDWFFDEYVYGTALPAYGFSHNFETGANGDQVVNFRITQSNVDDKFLMVVPVYLELANGKILRLAGAPMPGNTSRDFKVPLTGLKERPKRAMLNYYYDVLSTEGK